MSSYYGTFLNGQATVGSGGSATLESKAYSRIVMDPEDASAYVTIGQDGTVSGTLDSGGSGFIDSYDWLNSGAAADYEVKVDVISGTVSGTTGSWLPLTTDRTYTKARTVIGTATADITISIRRASDGVELARANQSLTATVEF